MLKKLIGIFLLLLLVSCETAVEAPKKMETLKKTFSKDPLSIDIEISPEKPTLKDRLEISIQVTTPPELEVLMPQFDKTLQDSFFVYSFYEDPLRIAEKKIYRQVYQLETLFSGKVTFPALEFRYQRHKKPTENTGVVVKTDPFSITIEAIEMKDIKDIHDIQDVQQLPKESKQYLWLVLAGILLLGFTVAKLRKSATIENNEPNMTPEEFAWQCLNDLLAKNYVEQNNYQAFYFELTMIVRSYIERKYDIKAPNQTTEEFMDNIRNSEIFSENLQQFLEAADVVKYAAQIPSAEEVENCFNTAKKFMQLETINTITESSI